MKTPSAIRLLASTNNACGDLFTRLVKDLFFALGYDDLRLDVHKSGRELDIQGVHRLEPRRMTAECKAHAMRIGGDDLNKFFGALGRERDKHRPTPVAGYFVSLSGFRETGKEQELETSEQERVILIDGKQIIEELQRCRVLVSHAEGVEQAGHCAEHAGLKDAKLDGVELLGHAQGYLWAVFYSQGKARTDFVLIHADGTPLAESVALEVIKSDRDSGGRLHTLRYLPPPLPAPDRAALGRAAAERYCEWVAEECGYIQLDGLPADTDLSATRMKLERLFVPLKVVTRPDKSTGDQRAQEEKIEPLGEFLNSHPHVALLASPGGGKSTLLKRLAIAYAVPERRAEVDDILPERDWLPLFLRCRELRDRAHRPILELLDDLTQHAGMTPDETAAFVERIHETLRSGEALLLVDGLDEISDEGARSVFAQHLRTFLAMFPRASLVVTSREAGFRHVAGVIASACVQARLAHFDEADVRRLCELWHVEIVGDNDKVRADARALAKTIWNNERIRSLVENPLLLTTLLVVKRWIGELPRNRVELYRRAIEVLIRTWNVEGYAPLDEDETLAQLSYVACEMMQRGTQQIGHRALLKLLRRARKELEAELQFAAISVPEFVKRIEYRSSVLMQTGHERLDGDLQAVYEFRHLTFQEYLAARGFVEEQYPGRNDAHGLANLLEPHFKDEGWLQVIPLAAVLAGRRSEQIMKQLVAECANLEIVGFGPRTPRLQVVLLRQCLLDEVQTPASTLRSALEQVGRLSREGQTETGSPLHGQTVLIRLRRGKYGSLLQEVTETRYFSGTGNWDEYADVMELLAFEDGSVSAASQMSSSLADSLFKSLEKGDRKEKVRAALVCMELAFGTRDFRKPLAHGEPDERYQKLRDAICGMLDPTDPPSSLAASWALAWIGVHKLCTGAIEPKTILCLYHLWRDSPSNELRRFAAWALSAQPLLARDTFSKTSWGDCDDFLKQVVDGEGKGTYSERARAALLVAWYRRAPWDDPEIAARVAELRKYRAPNDQFGDDLLENLGETGRQLLQESRKNAE